MIVKRTAMPAVMMMIMKVLISNRSTIVNIARIAKAAPHKLPEKSSFACPVHDDNNGHYDHDDHLDHDDLLDLDNHEDHDDHGDHDDHSDHDNHENYDDHLNHIDHKKVGD